MLVDDFVHQVLDAFVGSHEARQLSQAGAVAAVAHAVLKLREVVVEAIGGIGQHGLVGRWDRGRGLSNLINRSLLSARRNLIIPIYCPV